jgi:hypothetical protein
MAHLWAAAASGWEVHTCTLHHRDRSDGSSLPVPRLPFCGQSKQLTLSPEWDLCSAKMGKLRDVHEAIAGKTLEKDTFRRAMDPHLRGTGTLSSGTVGRPSQRFRRAR